MWSGKDLDVIPELFVADAVHHGAAFPEVQGPEAVAHAVAMQLAAFPDIALTMDAAIASNDLVAVRW